MSKRSILSEDKAIAACRTLPAYAEGRKAYRHERTDCPYPTGGPTLNRTAWWTGWYDERTKQRMAGVFDEYGVIWP